MGIPNNRFVIMERREKVYSMLSQGLNELEIAKQLKVDQSTICRDVNSIRKQSLHALDSIAKDILPYEFNKCLGSIEQIIKKCWIIVQGNKDQWTNKDKINALKLLKETVRTKFEILCDGPTVLQVQKLEDEVNKLKQDNDPSQRSFFVLPALQRPSDDDVR